MKFRESGMPDEQMWSNFFNPTEILKKLYVTKDIKGLLDIGCGYGTFTIPTAKTISGKVLGINIEEEMVHKTRSKAEKEGV